MKTKLKPAKWIMTISLLIILGLKTNAQLPADFPAFTVTTYNTNAVGDGYIFLTVTETSTNVGYYAMILKNDGTPVWYQHTPDVAIDLKVLPDGYLHYGQFYHTLSWTGGGDVYHQILDNGYNLKETITTGNGYLPESHEIQVLPNGNVLELSYYQSYMDLSKIATGAYPNALVAGAVIQELNAQRNVVWQWRSWDHYDFKTYYGPALAIGAMATVRNPVIDSFHINSITLDNDGNLLISNFMMDVEKINRQTGQVMWRLGGFANQFTFVGENPQQAAAHFSGHHLTRLANGNILIFCNADQQATRSSKIYEYKLDETNKIAQLVWSYTPATPWYSWHAGSAQRLDNGNTFIGWGGGGIVAGVGGLTNNQVPACTEVTAAGQVVFEIKFNDPLVNSYRAFRFPYPPQPRATVVTLPEMSVGNSYDFGAAGLALTVTGGGGGYNSLTVSKEAYAPVFPQFNGRPPLVLPARLTMAQTSLPSLGADMEFDAATFGIQYPTNMTVYYRGTVGQGVFQPQTTDYNPVTGKLLVSMNLTGQGGSFGEFIFGYPDVPEVLYPPLLNAVETYRGVQPLEFIAPLQATTGTVYAVNQTLPISLAWSPKGFAGWYQLQIDTTTNFVAPLVDVPYQTDACFVWSNAAPGTTYYYRVSTSDDSGTGDWSIGSFQTVAPTIAVTAPNGGEAWRRGLYYFVKWNGNTPEPVAIDLYKGGVFLKTLATNANTGAYRWSIGFNLSPGRDYSITVRSTTNGILSAASNLPFSIVDAPTITAGSVSQLPDGSVQFAYNAPGAGQMTVLGSTNLTSWQVIQTLPLTNDSGIVTNSTPAGILNQYYRLRVP